MINKYVYSVHMYWTYDIDGCFNLHVFIFLYSLLSKKAKEKCEMRRVLLYMLVI